jgi:hypothetical protein
MRDQLEQRVTELREEQEKGQRMLADLDARRAELQQTLLRISGAIQVLQELLAGSAPSAQDGAAPPADSAAPAANGVLPSMAGAAPAAMPVPGEAAAHAHPG